jgi:very-short-patch-repair endonuclease
VLGEYIVDFLAPACRLVVEVDGAYHARRLRADARRDARLRVLGFRVVHLEAELVMRELPLALDRIRAALGCSP